MPHLHVYRDGPVESHNPNLANLKEDVLYHLDLSDKKNDLPGMFGDVKVRITAMLSS